MCVTIVYKILRRFPVGTVGKIIWIKCLKLLMFFSLLFILSCSSKPADTNTASLVTGKNSVTNDVIKIPPGLSPRGIDYSNAPKAVAFGSCADQNVAQPIWNAVVSSGAELFLSMGDNVYASKSEDKPIGQQYKKLSLIPEFIRARENIAFMATWDDHDYGQNDGGNDNPEKKIAREEFLKFWPYVRDSIPLNQEGIYHSKIIGGVSPGRRKPKGPTLQVIMLDTRTFRSPLRAANDLVNPLHKYDPWEDKDKTLLGASQWEWLETQFEKPSDVRILVSSIQLIPTEHGFEKWGNFPNERQRFFDLLKKHRIKNLVVLSGDRHLSAVSKTEIKGLGILYEITSSGLTKTSNLEEKDTSYVTPTFNAENFGMLQIDYRTKKVKAEIRDIEGKIVLGQEIKLN